MVVDLNSNTLVITLTVYGLNDPIKWRHDHFVKKKNQDLILCCLQEAILNVLRLKVKEWKKIYYTNTYHKKVGANISTADKVDFRARNVNKAAHQEDTIILYVHMRESQNV